MVRERAAFLGAFMRQPFVTASLTPSSSHLAEAMVAGMDLGRAHTVVELGPGTGSFTRVIERELSRSARLVCMEINPAFARSLAARFPRAQVVNDCAANLERYLPDGEDIDCVISGLPWVLLPPEEQRRLLEPMVRRLRRGGTFATFGYSHGFWLPAGRRFRVLLREHFRCVDVSRSVWRNLPPAFVYRCER